MHDALREPVKKKVGGTLSHLDPLRRLEMLRANARLLCPGPWRSVRDDGSFVRKTVGAAR